MAECIASWDTGQILVAEMKELKGKVVTINFVPTSTRVTQIGWDFNSQGDQLILNSLFYVSNQPK